MLYHPVPGLADPRDSCGLNLSPAAAMRSACLPHIRDDTVLIWAFFDLGQMAWRIETDGRTA